MSLPAKQEWSKSYICRPKDNLISHVHLIKKVKTFIPSYLKKEECRENMHFIMGGEYGRIWLKERDAMIRKRGMKPKVIKNNYAIWIEKHKKKITDKEPEKRKETSLKDINEKESEKNLKDIKQEKAKKSPTKRSSCK